MPYVGVSIVFAVNGRTVFANICDIAIGECCQIVIDASTKMGYTNVGKSAV